MERAGGRDPAAAEGGARGEEVERDRQADGERVRRAAANGQAVPREVPQPPRRGHRDSRVVGGRGGGAERGARGGGQQVVSDRAAAPRQVGQLRQEPLLLQAAQVFAPPQPRRPPPLPQGAPRLQALPPQPRRRDHRGALQALLPLRPRRRRPQPQPHPPPLPPRPGPRLRGRAGGTRAHRVAHSLRGHPAPHHPLAEGAQGLHRDQLRPRQRRGALPLDLQAGLRAVHA